MRCQVPHRVNGYPAQLPSEYWHQSADALEGLREDMYTGRSGISEEREGGRDAGDQKQCADLLAVRLASSAGYAEFMADSKVRIGTSRVEGLALLLSVSEIVVEKG